MDDKVLDVSLDIVTGLITGEDVSAVKNSALYEEYSSSAAVYDTVNTILKKMNLKIYEHADALYVSPGDNNKVFGYSNEELKKELGLKVNMEIYLCYYIIYNIMMMFYTDSATASYLEFVKIEDIIEKVDATTAGIISPDSEFVLDEMWEYSFKQLALMWNDLQPVSPEETGQLRAAKNSKAGYIKTILNFLEKEKLMTAGGGRYYITGRMRALVEGYFDDNKGRLYAAD